MTDTTRLPSGGTGWRAWGVDRRTGSLGRAFLYANQQEWDTDWNEAWCRRALHHAPAPGCFCGFHLMTDENDAWAFAEARYQPGVSRPCVVGRVQYDGAAMTSPDPCDPASTLRVERARVVGPIVVLPGAEPFAAAIRDYYRVRVIDQELHQFHRVLFG